ncbi:MAG: VWA domain-containing protein [Lachnospiraceae bacterium]|nr:VWA domain-containing protein [Lachnospiraceae bacterium]
MRRRAEWVLACLTLIGCLLLPAPAVHADAQEFRGERKGLDVVFAVDCSGSMKNNDPDRMGIRMMQAFIDTVHSEDIRIGYVAYDHEITDSFELQSMSEPEQREELKGRLEQIVYTGDTDMGLGLSAACDLIPFEEGRRRMVVLISDGESDLDGSSGRTLEQSDQDLEACVRQCGVEGVPVYTVAFGDYDGDGKVLRETAEATGAETFHAQSPDTLIEILYSIFDGNLSCRIRQFSDAVYADGEQKIRCILEDAYVDETNVLLVSSGGLKDAVLEYDKRAYPMQCRSIYAAGKLGVSELTDAVKDLTIRTTTKAGENLKVYLISYRALTPSITLETSAVRNEEIPCQVFFRTADGGRIEDEAFYHTFQMELYPKGDPEACGFRQTEPSRVRNGVLEGSVSFGRSGACVLQGTLADSWGSYEFCVPVTVKNTPPQGSVPVIRCTSLKEDVTCDLSEYISDPDGDELRFSIEDAGEGLAGVSLDRTVLKVSPRRPGTGQITLRVSDGETALACSVSLEVVSPWRHLWWIPLLSAAAGAVLWQFLHRPRQEESGKGELEQLADEKTGNRFAGRLDAYVMVQPDHTEEIPPLTFSMYRLSSSSVCLGGLMKEYPDLSGHLDLGQIHLIAEEGRRMLLYHSSESTVMAGNIIVCRQTPHPICFGDVLYITSPDGAYELAVHYIAVYQ